LERKKKLLLFVSAALVTVMLVAVVSSTLSSTSSTLGPTAQSSGALLGTPTPIPGVIRTGMYIRIGVNKGGTFGVGKGTDPGTGFQYPIGPQFESLAIWWWGEGYAIFYKTLSPTGGWVDNKAYWWPSLGWPPKLPDCNLIPVGFASLRDDDNRAIIKATLNTADGALKLEFTFSFPKPQKYVLLETKITNLGEKGALRDVLYKRIVDWDIHQNTANSWTSDSHSAYASLYSRSLYRFIELSVSGYTPTGLENLPAYVDLCAWDDINATGSIYDYPTTRYPGMRDIQSHNREIPYFDGNAAIYYDLGEMKERTTKAVYTVYQAGWNYMYEVPLE